MDEDEDEIMEENYNYNNKNSTRRNEFSKDITNKEDSLGSDSLEYNEEDDDGDNNEGLKYLNEEDHDYEEKNSLILESILLTLEKLSTNMKNNQKFLNNILKEINTAVNLLINEFTSESKNSKNKEGNDLFITEEKSNTNRVLNHMKVDTNSRVVYLLKIETLNRKIMKLKEEINNMKYLLFNSDNKIKDNNLFNFIMKKLKEYKKKNKCDEFKYLLFIENQQKKINELENKINIKNNENLPKDVVHSIRCFPNYVQLNNKEDINIKTIPLSKYLQMIGNKNNPHKGINKKKNTIPSLSVNNRNKNDLCLTINPINNTFINSKIRNKITKYKTDANNNKNKGDNTDITKIEAMKNNSKNKNDLKKEINEFNPDSIITKNKEFFISHPTIYMAGVAKKKEQVYIGLPKKLIKLNKGGNFKSMMVFPSSLNQTLVNLEKLKRNNLTKNE